MIDVSMSITTNGMTGRHREQGTRFAHDVLMDAQGRPTNDPASIAGRPARLAAAARRAVGRLQGVCARVADRGADLGAFRPRTRRTGRPTGARRSWSWPSTRAVSAAARRSCARRAGWRRRCRTNPPVPGGESPRLPGQRALRRRAEQLAHGVELHAGIAPASRRPRRGGRIRDAAML